MLFDDTLMMFLKINEFRELFGSFFFPLFGDVRVNIHRCLDVGMAKPFLDLFEWRSHLKQQAAMGVPEAVECDMLERVFFFKVIQPLIHQRRQIDPILFRREQELVRSENIDASHQVILRLCSFPLPEFQQRLVVDADFPDGFLRFRRCYDRFFRFIKRYRLGDVDRFADEIDVAPLQGQHLAFARARKCQQPEEHGHFRIIVILQAFEEEFQFIQIIIII